MLSHCIYFWRHKRLTKVNIFLLPMKHETDCITIKAKKKNIKAKIITKQKKVNLASSNKMTMHNVSDRLYNISI